MPVLSWIHEGPNLVASTVSDSGFLVTGGLNRCFPNGASAYGTPLNTLTLVILTSVVPWTVNKSVLIVKSLLGAAKDPRARRPETSKCFHILTCDNKAVTARGRFDPAYL